MVEVGVGEADDSDEADSPGVEKFGLSALLLVNTLGVGTGMNWGGITLAGVAAAAAVRAPAFVFAVLFVPVPAFAPVWLAPIDLPLEPASPPAALPVIPTG